MYHADKLTPIGNVII